ncbi:MULTISPECIES: family 20 glycosylhydrolase [unclassified Leeuwenhoekiella]|uniref:beta-N-acetylhexosaminidase n=1 Tax=unclassified Leeuwenhoekiella TaxID=2615029 RepID=UPI000C60C50C|nr:MULTISPECIES: family 20 glycosylhydrolase [unclassified Leeuwenhoekiella]MAW94379.1 beta-N-acetylglucosaminidase [Leeuwenhoekiella sp.]MBA81056.1 beta-N-acetylglucosaminidase [Leeuwenhoekiella sp.]
MKHSVILRLSLALVLFSLCGNLSAQKGELSVIPIPTEYEIGEGQFVIDEHTVLYADPSEAEVTHIAEGFQQQLRMVTGMLLPVMPLEDFEDQQNTVVFQLMPYEELGAEGYQLEVTPDHILIQANKPAGLFYAVQTLYQLLPPEVVENEVVRAVNWVVPAVNITDVPAYKWRGLHLDTGRHISSIDFIKKYLDQMAAHKLNTFHWHLTEDQGWRLQINKYPLLTEVGPYRDSTLVGHYGTGKYDGKRYGGYYTQDEAREIVAYAKDRYITVIPEIEMPGHATAAVASYPQLGNTDKPVKTVTTWGVFPDIFNVEESTFDFLEDVLVEVLDIFPSKYIHIGGDEAPKDQWEDSERIQFKIDSLGLKDEHELQSYFITRIEKFLNSKGRQIIGWDEILEGGLAPNAAVMSWRGEEGGIAAAKDAHYVVMSPGSHLYFDHGQGDPDQEPLNIGGYLPLEKVYSYKPTPDALSDEEAKYIMGAQANVWTEYLPNSDSREYMVFPRISALAEVVWSGEDHKDWESFQKRIPQQLKRYELQDINYSSTIYNVEIRAKYDEKSKVFNVELYPQWEGTVHYTLDGSTPTVASHVYEKPLKLKAGTTVKAGLFADSELKGSITSETMTTPQPKN